MKQNVLVEIKLSIFGNIHCISWQMHCITGSSKRVLTTNQSTIRIQKNGNVQIVGMYCTNVVAKTNSAFSCSKASTIDDVNILWRTQRRLKFESGSKRVKVIKFWRRARNSVYGPVNQSFLK